MTINRVVTIALMVVAMIVAPLSIAPAWAGPRDEARAHYQRGNELFRGGDFKGAIAEFVAADKALPSPVLSYNIALCHDRLGQTEEALSRYRAYLKAVPDASNRAEVQASIERLEDALAAKPASGPKAKPDEAVAGDGGKGSQSEAASEAVTEEPAADGTAAAPPGDAEASAEAAPTEDGIVYNGTDPDLRRVAAIDVRKVSQLYRGSGALSPAEPEGEAEAGAGVQGPPDQSVASAGPAEGVASAPPAPPTRVGPEQTPPPPRQETPLYKKWWFWAIVGAGVLTIVLVASSSSDSDGGQGQTTRGVLLRDPASRLPDSGGGLTLWSF